VKDSSATENTKAMLDAFAKSGFDVFAAAEVFLLDNMRGGGKGCITPRQHHPARSTRCSELARPGRGRAARRTYRHARVMQKYR